MALRSGPGDPPVTPRNARFYRALFNEQMALHADGYDTPMLYGPALLCFTRADPQLTTCACRLTPWGGDFVRELQTFPIDLH